MAGLNEQHTGLLMVKTCRRISLREAWRDKAYVFD